MNGRYREFSRALKSHVGQQMFTSVPFLALFLFFILLIQSIFFFSFELQDKGAVPFRLSLVFAIVYLPVFFLLKKKPHFNNYSLLNFVLLLVFYLFELYVLIFLNIRYIWSLLLFVQFLAAYYLLSNRFFYGFTTVNFLVYMYYIVSHIRQDFPIDSLLAMVFALFLSLLIHGDRRKSLINLAISHEKQREINNRFRQLEENISQIFILCSSDFKRIFYISSALESILNISAEDLKSDPVMWKEFIHQGDKLRVDLEIESTLKDKKSRDFDFRFIDSDKTKWLHFEIFPVISGRSSVVDRFAIIIDDITESKLAELKLAEARSLDGEMAARIQRNLLFADFDFPIEGVDGAADSIPSLDVGGDYFDIYSFSPGTVDIIIADVMGKGRIAALLGAASKSSFMKARLDLSVECGSIPPIDSIVSETSRSLSAELMQMGKFITLQYARLDMDRQIFEFVDKGHTSILHYSARLRSFWSLKGWNMPMGFNPDEKEVLSLIPVEKGDFFFLYSDGIIEAENEEGDPFGERRLIYLLKNSIHLTSSQIINKIKNIIFHYSSADSYSDDITCIALKIEGEPDSKAGTNLILKGNRSSLQIVRTFTMEFLRKEFPYMSPDTANAVVLAINEAVANVIEHNYEKVSHLENREIFLEAEKKGEYCCFRLYWDGEEFDWSIVKAPDLSELKSGGYGVSLIRDIMDSVSYSSNMDNVQQLTLLIKSPVSEV